MRPQWLPRDIVAPVTDVEKEAVRVAQRFFRLVPTGDLDEATRACLRGLQRIHKLDVTGILDQETAAIIDRLRPWRLGADDGPGDHVGEAQQGNDRANPVDGG